MWLNKMLVGKHTILQLTIIWISNKMIIRRYLTDGRESFVAFQNNMVIAGVNSITRAIICSVPSSISKLREVPICQITAPLLTLKKSNDISDSNVVKFLYAYLISY